MLQDELLSERKSSAFTPSGINATGYVTKTKQQISKLEIEYRQKRQTVEQCKLTLVTKDLLQMSSINKSHMPCQYCGSADY